MLADGGRARGERSPSHDRSGAAVPSIRGYPRWSRGASEPTAADGMGLVETSAVDE